MCIKQLMDLQDNIVCNYGYVNVYTFMADI